MKRTPGGSAGDGQTSELRLDRVLGREVYGTDNRRVGRVEEFRARKHGAGFSVAEYVIGVAGLMERLDLGARLLVGRRREGYVARWDQLDLTDPDRPRLTCPVSELQKL
jgi:hypothetical protein